MQKSKRSYKSFKIIVIAKQTKASNSILNATNPSGASSNRTAQTEAGLSGSAATREVLKCVLGSTHTEGIVIEHSSP